MTSLREMNEKMTQWMNEKPGFGSGDEYRPMTGDVVIFNFISSGNDGDQFFKIYKAHIFDTFSNSGKRYPTQRYCPVQTGDVGVECPYCQQGHTVIKERMIMWWYVHRIYHSQLPKDKQLPVVLYENRQYFDEQINGFRRWEASAWRDSPWRDIVKLYEMNKGLHNFVGQLEVIGEQLARRYKVYALPNTPSLPPEIYEKAKAECLPLPQFLKEGLSTPIQIAPAQAQNAPQQPVGFGQPVQAAQPIGFGGIAASNVAPTPVSPIAFPTFTPTSAPPEEGTEEDNSRPMKAMF